MVSQYYGKFCLKLVIIQKNIFDSCKSISKVYYRYKERMHFVFFFSLFENFKLKYCHEKSLLNMMDCYLIDIITFR